MIVMVDMEATAVDGAMKIMWTVHIMIGHLAAMKGEWWLIMSYWYSITTQLHVYSLVDNSTKWFAEQVSGSNSSWLEYKQEF